MNTATTSPVMLTRAQEILADAMTEDDLQDAIEEMLDTLGWRWFHDVDSRKNRSGLPDIVAVRRGRLLFAELKTTRGRVRTEQRGWLNDLSNADIEAYIWRPRDWHAGTIEEVLR